jgi:UDP-N-acetylglucosamine:LPS N-acetylglucosamine transferase
MPDASDLRDAHRLYLDYLESARAAYVIMESECATEKFDDRITALLQQSLNQLRKYKDLVQRFTDTNGLH